MLQPGLARGQEFASGITSEQSSEEWKKYVAGMSAGAKQAAGWAGQRAGSGWRVSMKLRVREA